MARNEGSTSVLDGAFIGAADCDAARMFLRTQSRCAYTGRVFEQISEQEEERKL